MKDVILLANESTNKAEIFYSIQGEGPQIGKPSIFVRMSNCDLYCSWCDTPYTWNWNSHEYVHERNVKFDKKAESTDMHIQAVVDEIFNYQCSRIIYTGGEPMLQQRRLSLLNKVLTSQRPFIF
jgi:organic radical activating enzyme